MLILDGGLLTVDSNTTDIKIRQVMMVGFKKKVPTDDRIHRISPLESLAKTGQNRKVLTFGLSSKLDR